MSRLSKDGLTPLDRARISLGIKEPSYVIAGALSEAGVDPKRAIEYLLCSPSEESSKVISKLNDLTTVEKKHVTIDDLAEAAGVEASRMLGLITEQMFVRSASVTGMIAAANAPKVMQAAIDYAQLPDGHQDRKMVLQATGAAPVPKNQTTYINVRDSNIGNSVVINKPLSFEDVMKDMDEFDTPLLEGK